MEHSRIFTSWWWSEIYTQSALHCSCAAFPSMCFCFSMHLLFQIPSVALQTYRREYVSTKNQCLIKSLKKKLDSYDSALFKIFFVLKVAELMRKWVFSPVCSVAPTLAILIRVATGQLSELMSQERQWCAGPGGHLCPLSSAGVTTGKMSTNVPQYNVGTPAWLSPRQYS